MQTLQDPRTKIGDYLDNERVSTLTQKLASIQKNCIVGDGDDKEYDIKAITTATAEYLWEEVICNSPEMLSNQFASASALKDVLLATDTVFENKPQRVQNLVQKLYWHYDDGMPPMPMWKNTTSKGAPKATKHNFEIMLAEYGVTPTINMLKGETEFIRYKDGKLKTTRNIVSDCATVGIDPKVVELYTDLVSKDATSYHPIKEMLVGVTWDGIDRVTQVIDCLPVEPQFVEYRNEVMRRWMRSAAHYLDTPFRSRLLPIIVGKENDGKSIWAERMFDWSGGFLGDADIILSDKDSRRRAMANWVVEISEPQSFFGNNRQSDIKRFVTAIEDTLRPPYWATDWVKPRQTALCATANKSDFLDGDEENTRFQVIPIIATVDLDSLNEVLGLQRVGDSNEVVAIDAANPLGERLQMFAQLLEEVANGEPYSYDQSHPVFQTASIVSQDFANENPVLEVLHKYWDFSKVETNDNRKRVGLGGTQMSSTEIKSWLDQEKTNHVDLRLNGKNSLGNALGQLLDQIKVGGIKKWVMPPLRTAYKPVEQKAKDAGKTAIDGLAGLKTS
ncbi:VapE family protein [Vibrio vulnificus]|uniref:VapE domain-containing protein n=1 Tax=Vibrio vulnificus TaxID=672 RepID=UPI0024DFF180|nr:VapE domain-containing protein [Vibrio vulnificus]MDK2606117.1 VapE family protein [Vibrio vulnificus]MDK2609861.1 VapE family protein [Vibrio vulnificus]MDK2627359.1 VapE family protein [Vibrio vulnificus]MDK2702804.1 VapE family protein [Vibrio vulnificus]